MNPQKPFQISRRSFLRRCSATAAATGLPLWFVERQLALAEEEPVKREMPSFFDTRINRLGEMTRKANAPVLVEPKPVPVAAAAPPMMQQPPLLPDNTALAVQHTANMGVEDAAAQLLRPMLRQWLTENMPKIVEKALRSEAGSDGPSAGPALEVRKTLR